ncbi:hypothetical protein M9978_07600 [Sphingomonas sp. MG17]|uniref:Uncharacterized protein n=1 Tax=Sphingomonas tagetis TaxID=2949092 RepID=A0A9X2HI17_9SPHN|nr:hypothetical protein [Sphingomonas tagetis]MCP3730292.1 hypothetical protein [Sphingomonas tagetis]
MAAAPLRALMIASVAKDPFARSMMQGSTHPAKDHGARDVEGRETNGL